MYSRSSEGAEAGVRVQRALSQSFRALTLLVIRDYVFSRGDLRIAEVASRITDVKEFTSVICSVGFRLVSKVR